MQLQRQIIQHVFWRGLYFVSLFALNILISRRFKADGSGWIYYFINNLSFLILIVSLSLESGAAYYVSNGRIAPIRMGIFFLVWYLGVALLSLAFMQWLIPASFTIHISRKELVIGSLCYIFGVLLSTYFVALFFADRVFRLPNLLLLFLNSFLVLLFLAYGNQSFVLDHFMTIYLVSFLLQGVLLSVVYFFHRQLIVKWDLQPRFPRWMELNMVFRYSLMALAGNILFFLICRVDYWFVKKFCSYTDLGNYIQVSKLVQILILVPSIVATTIFPFVAGGQKEEVNKAMKMMTRCLLSSIGIICILLAVFGYWTFPFIFGRSFMQMDILFILLIPGILALSAHYPLTAYYAGKKRMIVNIKGTVLALLIIVAGDIIFIPLAGVKAAPIVSSIGYTSYFIYVLFVFSKEYQTSFKGFFMMNRSDIRWIKKMMSP